MATASIIAISQRISENELQQALDRTKALGYEVVYDPEICDDFFIYAGSIYQRTQELHKAFLDTRSTIIFSVRGGHGVNHLLSELDMKMIKKHCKSIVGYSDLTILLNYLYQHTGQIMYHGPNLLKTFPAGDRSTQCLSDALAGKKLMFNINSEDILISGTAKGVIVGGNLALLIRSLGTPYENGTANKILFIEAADKDPWWIYDSLMQLQQAGKFKTCKGVILGHFTNCSDHEAYMIEFFRAFEIPIIYRQKFGHGVPNYTIPIGGMCTIDSERLVWSIRQ